MSPKYVGAPASSATASNSLSRSNDSTVDMGGPAAKYLARLRQNNVHDSKVMISPRIAAKVTSNDLSPTTTAPTRPLPTTKTVATIATAVSPKPPSTLNTDASKTPVAKWKIRKEEVERQANEKNTDDSVTKGESINQNLGAKFGQQAAWMRKKNPTSEETSSDKPNSVAKEALTSKQASQTGAIKTTNSNAAVSPSATATSTNEAPIDGLAGMTPAQRYEAALKKFKVGNEQTGTIPMTSSKQFASKPLGTTGWTNGKDIMTKATSSTPVDDKTTATNPPPEDVPVVVSESDGEFDLPVVDPQLKLSTDDAKHDAQTTDVIENMQGESSCPETVENAAIGEVVSSPDASTKSSLPRGPSVSEPLTTVIPAAENANVTCWPMYNGVALMVDSDDVDINAPASPPLDQAQTDAPKVLPAENWFGEAFAEPELNPMPRNSESNSEGVKSNNGSTSKAPLVPMAESSAEPVPCASSTKELPEKSLVMCDSDDITNYVHNASES